MGCPDNSCEPEIKLLCCQHCCSRLILPGETRKRGKQSVIPPGIEPGTLSVLDSRDNHYTTESLLVEPDNNTVPVLHVHHNS